MNVADINAAVERDSSVVAARTALAEARRKHSAAVPKVMRRRGELARADDARARAEAQLEQVRRGLPELAADVLSGEATESAWDEALEQIRRLEQVIARVDMGRSVLKERGKEDEFIVGMLAREGQDAEKRLEQACRAARDELSFEARR